MGMLLLLFRVAAVAVVTMISTVHTLSSSSAPPVRSTTVPLAYTDYYSSSTTTTTATEQRPPAIFVHGLLGNKRNFVSLARSLGDRLQHPRTLVGVDLRHHGESAAVTTTTTTTSHSMSYTSMAHDILQFMDDHDMETAELIGHSVGGKVAQYVYIVAIHVCMCTVGSHTHTHTLSLSLSLSPHRAVALLAPDRIVGLVVLDIAPVTYTVDEPQWQAVADILRILASNNSSSSAASREAMDGWLKEQGITDPAIRAFVLTNYDGVRWTIPVDLLYRELETLAGFALQHDDDDDKQWHGDAFFIHGGQSRFVRSAHLATIGQYFPQHLLTTVRGAGHWIHAEAPEDTTALLQQYLDR